MSWFGSLREFGASFNNWYYNEPMLYSSLSYDVDLELVTEFPANEPYPYQVNYYFPERQCPKYVVNPGTLHLSRLAWLESKSLKQLMYLELQVQHNLCGVYAHVPRWLYSANPRLNYYQGNFADANMITYTESLWLKHLNQPVPLLPKGQESAAHLLDFSHETIPEKVNFVEREGKSITWHERVCMMARGACTKVYDSIAHENESPTSPPTLFVKDELSGFKGKLSAASVASFGESTTTGSFSTVTRAEEAYPFSNDCELRSTSSLSDLQSVINSPVHVTSIEKASECDDPRQLSSAVDEHGPRETGAELQVFRHLGNVTLTQVTSTSAESKRQITSLAQQSQILIRDVKNEATDNNESLGKSSVQESELGSLVHIENIEREATVENGSLEGSLVQVPLQSVVGKLVIEPSPVHEAESHSVASASSGINHSGTNFSSGYLVQQSLQMHKDECESTDHENEGHDYISFTESSSFWFCDNSESVYFSSTDEENDFTPESHPNWQTGVVDSVHFSSTDEENDSTPESHPNWQTGMIESVYFSSTDEENDSTPESHPNWQTGMIESVYFSSTDEENDFTPESHPNWQTGIFEPMYVSSSDVDYEFKSIELCTIMTKHSSLSDGEAESKESNSVQDTDAQSLLLSEATMTEQTSSSDSEAESKESNSVQDTDAQSLLLSEATMTEQTSSSDSEVESKEANFIQDTEAQSFLLSEETMTEPSSDSDAESNPVQDADAQSTTMTQQVYPSDCEGGSEEQQRTIQDQLEADQIIADLARSLEKVTFNHTSQQGTEEKISFVPPRLRTRRRVYFADQHETMSVITAPKHHFEEESKEDVMNFVINPKDQKGHDDPKVENTIPFEQFQDCFEEEEMLWIETAFSEELKIE